MAILPRRQTFGETFGSGLGQGLSTGLQSMAQWKINQMQDQQQSQKMMPLFMEAGMTPEAARAYSKAPVQVQVEGLKHARMQKALGDFPGEQGGGYNSMIQQGLIQPGMQAPQGIQQQPGMQSPQDMQPQYTQEQKQILQNAYRLSQATDDPRIFQQAQLEVAKMKERSSLESAKATARELREKIKDDRAKQHEINVETKPAYDTIIKSAKSSRDNELRLDRMDKLNKEGNLGVPLLNTSLKTLSKGIFGFGIDLTSLMTADAQEFDKLSTDFLKNVKDIFGARITDAEVANYLKTVPTLSQSKPGRTQIINNLKILNKAHILRKQAMDDIITENNGSRPANMDLLIEKKIGPELDKINDVFISQGTGRSEKPGLLQGVLYY